VVSLFPEGPQPPFVFYARGGHPGISRALGANRTEPWPNQRTIHTVPLEPYENCYGAQVTYLNKLLGGAARRLLAQSSHPPNIIIQGLRSVPNWEVLTRRQAVEQPDIFYAVYPPPSAALVSAQVELHDSISPVNAFRVVLGRYFDTTMALLSDRSDFSVLVRPCQFCDADPPESYPVIGRSSGDHYEHFPVFDLTPVTRGRRRHDRSAAAISSRIDPESTNRTTRAWVRLPGYH